MGMLFSFCDCVEEVLPGARTDLAWHHLCYGYPACIIFVRIIFEYNIQCRSISKYTSDVEKASIKLGAHQP